MLHGNDKPMLKRREHRRRRSRLLVLCALRGAGTLGAGAWAASPLGALSSLGVASSIGLGRGVKSAAQGIAARGIENHALTAKNGPISYQLSACQLSTA